MSGTVVAACVDEGVVFIVEKPIPSKLMVPTTNLRIFTIDDSIGIAISGILADAHELVHTARKICENYRSLTLQKATVRYLANELGHWMLQHTLSDIYRPYGVSVCIGGVDDDGKSSLFSIDPSGAVNRCYATAFGQNGQSTKTELERKLGFSSRRSAYNGNDENAQNAHLRGAVADKLNKMSLKDVLYICAKAAHSVHEEGDSPVRLECSFAVRGRHSHISEEEVNKLEERIKNDDDKRDDDDELI